MPVDHLQLPFPFRCFGCNRLVITEKFTSVGLGVQTGYWVGKMRNVLPDPLTAADPIPAWLSPVAGNDLTGGGPVVTADTRVRSYTVVHRNTLSGWIGCTLFATGSNSAACQPTTRRDTHWCHHLLLQQHCAQVLWNWPPSEPGWCLLASVRLHGHKPEPKPCCISMPVHRSSTCMPCTSWQHQIATVVEGCHDAGIGSDPHCRGHGVSFGLVPLFSFSVAPGPSEISSVPVTISDKIWYSDILEIELGVQMYPGDCPGTDVHISACLQWQVVQERRQTSGWCRCGSFRGEWPATPVSPQLCVGPPSPPSIAHWSCECPHL